ncbi:1,3-beta-glucanosyltransferase [Calycina marina]|uniref:1,3-beta-glucanosyltransferase n=1 Tax=Calycina marina TaxID=1763456 RepID=A0A9P7Z214_9HELO|nr:1,3-beta-glucanosyltransferase [Calycina marina]
MKSLTAIIAFAAASTAFAAPAVEKRTSANLTAITVKGNAFFKGDDRFYIRGVDYQPGGSSDLADPIANVTTCTRDIAKFKDLGINTIRIYTVDNSADHDDCMQLLADAGIYLVLDVNTPLYSLNRDSPLLSYNSKYLQNVFATMEAFSGYTNTLAYFSGNEVVNTDNSTSTAPYVKAVTRDMRSYLSSRGHRQIPVGYSAADVDSNRLEMAQYMNCGTDDERSDFFAFNDYSWCDPSSFTTSGWDQKVKNFTGYGLPLFLSEYGCNTNTREWEEVTSLYSTDMTAVYSGGIVYEYSNNVASNYGLVTISGTTVTNLADYSTLKAKYASVDNPTGDGGYNSTGGASGCPAKSANWDVDGDSLPAIPVAAEAYLTSGAGTGVGLTGTGSQDGAGEDVDGGQSTGIAVTGSGTATTDASASANSSSSDESAAAILAPPSMTPIIVGALVTSFTIFGSFLL